MTEIGATYSGGIVSPHFFTAWRDIPNLRPSAAFEPLVLPSSRAALNAASSIALRAAFFMAATIHTSRLHVNSQITCTEKRGE